MYPKQKKRESSIRVTLLSLGSRLYSAAIKHAEFAKPNSCFNLCPPPLRACVPFVFPDEIQRIFVNFVPRIKGLLLKFVSRILGTFITKDSYYKLSSKSVFLDWIILKDSLKSLLC
jgi:hypothetical protein